MVTDIHTAVAALFIHGDHSSRPEDGAPTSMLSMQRVEAVTGRGIRQDRRFFRPADIGRDRKRQVSLIDEGTIRRHETRFGPIERRFIKAQIVLEGDVRLPDFIGHVLDFERGPQLVLAIHREPCYAMDFIAPGLKDAMEDGEQGALARVIRDGEIWVGQRVVLRAASLETSVEIAV
jgi:hypothetical protein